jgi:phospholipid-binding lipoprotein MlaA
VSLACLTPAVAAAQSQVRSPDDPFEAFNRKSFAFSIKLDALIVGPLAKVSAKIIPPPIERAVHNIIVNLSEPQVILNNLLQGRAQGAIKAVTRVVVNTTVGLGGILDVAAGAGLHYDPNGFGDTLGRYGVKPGPYLFIPILGPSDIRDLVGSGVDQVSTPMYYIDFPYRTTAGITIGALGGLDQRARAAPELMDLLDSAADPYATLRSTYLQSREAQIRGQLALPPLPDIEGPGEIVPSPDTKPPPVAGPPPPAGPVAGADPATTSPPPAPGPADAVPSPAPLPSPAKPSGPESRSPDPAPA